MTYSDGVQIIVGDMVRIERGRTPGIIVEVHETTWDTALGPLEPGVMVEAAPFGLVYLPSSQFSDDGLIFEARGKSNMRWSGP
jgi:hypothetical protein